MLTTITMEQPLYASLSPWDIAIMVKISELEGEFDAYASIVCLRHHMRPM